MKRRQPAGTEIGEIMNAIQTGVLLAVLVPFGLAAVAELIRIFKD